MNAGKPAFGTIKTALVLAAAAVSGAGVAWLATSYTEPDGNPSLSEGRLEARAGHDRKPMEPWAFADENGTPLTPADFAGRVVLVNLWATWCPPCVAEMPSLDRLQAALAGQDFQVVAISLDRGGPAVPRRWLDQAGLKQLRVFHAPPSDFPGALLPTSILVDRAGRVAWRGEGAFDWSRDEAVAEIRMLLAEPKSGG